MASHCLLLKNLAESALSIPEVRAIRDFGREKRERLEIIKRNFLEKGALQLWWDSKLSEEERWLSWYFYLYLYRHSDKWAVAHEIQKFIEFYGYLENIPSLTLMDIDEMNNEVKDFLRQAKMRMRTTNSKTIYEACKKCVTSNIEIKVQKMRDAVGELEFKKLRDNFNQIVQKEAEKWEREFKMEIDTLRECNKVKAEEEKLMTENFECKLQEIESKVSAMHSALGEVVQFLSEEKQKEFKNIVDEIAVNR